MPGLIMAFATWRLTVCGHAYRRIKRVGRWRYGRLPRRAVPATAPDHVVGAPPGNRSQG